MNELNLLKQGDEQTFSTLIESVKLKNILLLFVVPYIEKVDGIKNSMDQRIIDIFIGILLFNLTNKFKKSNFVIVH